jgi:hypothetical protein
MVFRILKLLDNVYVTSNQYKKYIYFICQPWIERQLIPLNRSWTSTRLHGVISSDTAKRYHECLVNIIIFHYDAMKLYLLTKNGLILSWLLQNTCKAVTNSGQMKVKLMKNASNSTVWDVNYFIPKAQLPYKGDSAHVNYHVEMNYNYTIFWVVGGK